MIAVGATLVSTALTHEPQPEPEIPTCEPIPKLLHYEILEVRESRLPHQGQVRLSFTIGPEGQVRDVKIADSTDDWFNDLSIQSVLKWRYKPPTHICRATTTLKFMLKD
jgi:TonB family protein